MSTAVDLPPASGDVLMPEVNCGAGVVEHLSDRHDREEFGLSVAPGPRGVAARAVFEAVKSGAKSIDSLQDAAEELRTNEDLESGSSAELAWSWADDGGRRGGHSAVLEKDDDDSGCGIRTLSAVTGMTLRLGGLRTTRLKTWWRRSWWVSVCRW